MTENNLGHPTFEEDYRAYSLHDDVDRLKTIFSLVLGAFVLFMPSDYGLFGFSQQFFVLLAGRLVAITVIVSLLWRLRKPIAPVELDRWHVAAIIAVMGSTLHLYASRPLHQMNHALSALVVVLVSLVLPNRVRFQSWAAVLYAICSMTVLMFKSPGLFTIVGVGGALFLAAILGIMTAQLVDRSLRARFQAHRQETETRITLEKALEEVKTLRGLLPICSNCKKIRSEDGSWQAVELYVRDRTHAEFTHGICEQCSVELYPDYQTK